MSPIRTIKGRGPGDIPDKILDGHPRVFNSTRKSNLIVDIVKVDGFGKFAILIKETDEFTYSQEIHVTENIDTYVYFTGKEGFGISLSRIIKFNSLGDLEWISVFGASDVNTTFPKNMLIQNDNFISAFFGDITSEDSSSPAQLFLALTSDGTIIPINGSNTYGRDSITSTYHFITASGKIVYFATTVSSLRRFLVLRKSDPQVFDPLLYNVSHQLSPLPYYYNLYLNFANIDKSKTRVLFCGRHYIADPTSGTSRWAGVWGYYDNIDSASPTAPTFYYQYPMDSQSTSDRMRFVSIDSDSSFNVYVAGQITTSSDVMIQDYSTLTKYTLSNAPTSEWSVRYIGSYQMNKVHVTSDGRIFIAGQLGSNNKYGLYFAEINPANGSVIWANKLTFSGNVNMRYSFSMSDNDKYTGSRSIVDGIKYVDKVDRIFVTCTIAPNFTRTSIFVASLPANGDTISPIQFPNIDELSYEPVTLTADDYGPHSIYTQGSTSISAPLDYAYFNAYTYTGPFTNTSVTKEKVQ